MMTHIYSLFLDAYSTYGEYNWNAKLRRAEYALEPAACLLTIASRMDSCQNCIRSLGFHPSCSYEKCRQCSSFGVMLNGVGIRGTIGIVAQQLANQFPYVNGTEIRSARYGHADFADIDRTKINFNYGEFSFIKFYLQF